MVAGLSQTTIEKNSILEMGFERLKPKSWPFVGCYERAAVCVFGSMFSIPDGFIRYGLVKKPLPNNRDGATSRGPSASISHLDSHSRFSFCMHCVYLFVSAIKHYSIWFKGRFPVYGCGRAFASACVRVKWADR